MSNILAIPQGSTLQVALTTGEEIEREDLPVLRVYRTEDGGCILAEGMENIEKALIESLEYLGQQHSKVLSFKVEVVPMSQRTKRINC